MVMRAPRYSREEFARRGREIFDRTVLPTLRPDHEGQFVALDIESGGYEIDPDDYTATERLLRRYPDAQTWLVQVGQPAAYRLGARPAAGAAE